MVNVGEYTIHGSHGKYIITNSKSLPHPVGFLFTFYLIFTLLTMVKEKRATLEGMPATNANKTMIEENESSNSNTTLLHLK